jgi:glycosyltransferase involved in cell wall biosynthesis
MKISVVLSNYNGARFLREALESVIAQDYDDYEFIIVDDGSTDGSPALIQDFAAAHPDRVRPLLEKENLGQAGGFNKGIAAARGGIVAFLDSDDLWMPDKLKNLAGLIAAHEPAGVYQHNLFFLRNGEKSTEPFRPALMIGDVYAQTQRSREMPFFVATSGLAFPRDVLEKIGPVPLEFRTCADGYLTRTAFCHGPVVSTLEAWGYYRDHEDNMTFGNPRHNAAGHHNRLVEALNRYYRENGYTLRLPRLETGTKSAKLTEAIRRILRGI